MGSTRAGVPVITDCQVLPLRRHRQTAPLGDGTSWRRSCCQDCVFPMTTDDMWRVRRSVTNLWHERELRKANLESHTRTRVIHEDLPPKISNAGRLSVRTQGSLDGGVYAISVQIKDPPNPRNALSLCFHGPGCRTFQQSWVLLPLVAQDLPTPYCSQAAASTVY